MNKLDQLFIRACKVNNDTERLISVHRRFYFSGQLSRERRFAVIAGRLEGIVFEYNPSKLRDFMVDMHPDNSWKFGLVERSDHWERCVAVLSSYIRYTEVSKFPGITPPAKFRSKG
jgi:hypothetical protein